MPQVLILCSVFTVQGDSSLVDFTAADDNLCLYDQNR